MLQIIDAQGLRRSGWDRRILVNASDLKIRLKKALQAFALLPGLFISTQVVAMSKVDSPEFMPDPKAWNGRDDSGAPVSSGVYRVRVVTDEGVKTKRVVVIR